MLIGLLFDRCKIPKRESKFSAEEGVAKCNQKTDEVLIIQQAKLTWFPQQDCETWRSLAVLNRNIEWQWKSLTNLSAASSKFLKPKRMFCILNECRSRVLKFYDIRVI